MIRGFGHPPVNLSQKFSLAPLIVEFLSGLVTDQFVNCNLRLNIDVAKGSESCFFLHLLVFIGSPLVMRGGLDPPVNFSQKFS